MNILSQEARERQAVVKLGLRKATLSELEELQAMVLDKITFAAYISSDLCALVDILQKEDEAN